MSLMPSTTTLVSHVSNTSPIMHGSSVAIDSNNHTPPLSPRSYTQQIPSPIFNNNTSNGNTYLNNTRYMPYVTGPQSQQMIDVYTSAAYSPISSPYGLAGNNLLEHDVKIEGISPHSTGHQIQHAHQQQHQMTHNMHSNQNSHSRSPSVDEERNHLQSQIMSLNLERPSVVNIKME